MLMRFEMQRSQPRLTPGGRILADSDGKPACSLGSAGRRFPWFHSEIYVDGRVQDIPALEDPEKHR